MFCSTSFFTLWRGSFHLYSFWVKNLLMLISLISRSSNYAFRSVTIFVLLKKGQPAKCFKIKHSFSLSMIFFCMIPAGVWWFQFLLIALFSFWECSLKGHQCLVVPFLKSSFSFRWEWRIIDQSASFLDLANHVCLVHIDVCLLLTPPSPSVGKMK